MLIDTHRGGAATPAPWARHYPGCFSPGTSRPAAASAVSARELTPGEGPRTPGRCAESRRAPRTHPRTIDRTTLATTATGITTKTKSEVSFAHIPR